MGLIDTIGSLITTPMVNSSNQRIANRTNAFNAHQSDLNRQFQAQEAQIAREWQEEQYNKYSSPKAMVSQYEEAGLNPALMYGQNLQSSTGSSPSPSGSAATGIAIPNQAPQFMNVVEDILALKKLDSEIDLMESQAESNRASAESSLASASQSRSQASLNHTVKKLTSKQISEIDSKIRLMSEQEISERRKQRLMVVQAALHSAESKQMNLKNALSDSFEQTFGYKADAQTINQLMGIAANVVTSVTSSIFDIFSLFQGKKKDGINTDIPLSSATGNVEW